MYAFLSTWRKLCVYVDSFYIETDFNRKMKNPIIPLVLFLVAATAACSHDDWHRSYDAEECNRLATMIDSRDSLSQSDYTAMIAQSEDILKFLIERTKEVSAEPDSLRPGAWRQLLADPDYLERFGYMFTLGSALYQADTSGRLDSDNARRFASLDNYNHVLAELCDAN